MIFLHPEFLYYMLPPLFIFFLFLLRKKERELNYFSQDVIDKLRVSSNTLTLKTRNYIFLLITSLILFALATPVINNGTVEVKAKSSDIIIALDISDSMLAEDVYPNRLKLAKQKALSLLELAPNERVGVIGFAKNSYLVSPLSFDHSAVGFLLRALNTDSITEKGTNFLSMLEVVQKSINNRHKKYLLLLSDGGDKKDFSKEIVYAKEHNIVVFILAIGTEKGAPIKMENGKFIQHNGKIIISKLNDSIAQLATKTGGVYIKSVNSDEDIKKMILEIEAHSVKKELKSQKIHRYIPLFYYPLALALFLLLIASSSHHKKVKVNGAMLVLLSMFFLTHYNAEASMLDFMELKKAKEAYENKEYVKSETKYKDYLQSNQNADVNYNIGNALYKQKKYKEAIQSYKKAKFKDNAKNAKKLANIGNAYAKEATQKSLEKAIESYEASLKLEEDKDTRENLEAVKKALKKKKQKQKKKKKQQKQKQDKEKKNKDKKKNQDKKKSDKEKKDSQGDKKSQEKKDKKQNKKDGKKKEKKQKKDAAKELENNKKQENKNIKKSPMKMSEEEEKKWLKQLNKKQSSFLYRLNKKTSKQENTNEKPW